MVCFNATTLWHFDAAEWAPSTASFAEVTPGRRHVRFAFGSGRPGESYRFSGFNGNACSSLASICKLSLRCPASALVKFAGSTPMERANSRRPLRSHSALAYAMSFAHRAAWAPRQASKAAVALTSFASVLSVGLATPVRIADTCCKDIWAVFARELADCGCRRPP